VDFSVKTNVLPCAVVTLLLEYAVCMDAMEGGHRADKGVGFESLRLVLGGLVKCMQTSETRLSRGVEAVIRFTEDAVRSMNDEVEFSGHMLDMLLRVCGKPSERSCESQQNASLLLGLHEARQKIGVAAPATASTASSASPDDTLDLEADTPVRVVQGDVSMASDASAGSPCLLSGEVAAKAGSRPAEACPSSPVNDQQVRPPDGTQRNSPRVRPIADEAPATPRKAMTVEKLKDVELAGKKVLPPMGSMSAPPKLAARSPSTQPHINLGSGSAQCIYPDLIGCTEGIALLYRHFPMGFRPFFSFYKVKTIGDLSALSVEKVKTFGLKDPVVTVRRALEEFSGRKNRMKSLLTSPFRQRAQQPPRTSSASSTPSIVSPSPSSLSKRPLHREQHGNERLQHKRTRRSLVLDAGEGDHEEVNEAVHRQPKLADRVTFCLPSGDAGETRITRPGEDSQDQQKAAEESEKESVQEKMSTLTIKLLQHLRRSTYYMDKLVAEEENLHSGEASLQTRATEMGGVISNYQEAHELVAKLTAQLQVAAETSSKRCRKLLNKRDEPAAAVMEILETRTSMAIDRSDLMLDESAEGVLAQTPHWNVRKGACNGAAIVVYSARSTPFKQQLWTVAIATLQEFIAPFPHPNLVQFLGEVTPEQPQQTSSSPNELVVTERLALSLYDVLHRDHVSLSRREVALIGIQVMQALVFLHRKQQTLGVCLTSRKVMLDGSRSVKLRRFGLELILRTGKAPPQLSGAVTSSALKTVYEMARDPPAADSFPSSPTSSNPANSGFTTVEQDLFAFGVLLLEMCAGEKPTNELFNRLSSVRQMDPVFFQVLQLTMALNGDLKTEDLTQQRHRSKSTSVTAEMLLQLLVANEQQRVGEETRLSTMTFPCFLYADRYFVAKEAEQVKLKLQERDRREQMDLKRLAAVEQELVEEQKNFAVLVLQLEQAQRDREREAKENQRLRVDLEEREQLIMQRDEEMKRVMMEVQERSEMIAALQTSLEKECEKVEKLRAARKADGEEKQTLLFKLLKMREDKSQLLAQKHEVEAECAAIARKVGSETEAMEDLEGRLTQAIYRWEQEQHARRKIERQAEGLSKQLLHMEEARGKFSSVLQQSPTGELDPKASLSYVLALKDKEVQELSLQLQEAFDQQMALQTDVARYKEEGHALEAVKEGLLATQATMREEQRALTLEVQGRDEEIAGLRGKVVSAQAEIVELRCRISDFEDHMNRQAKQKADEGMWSGRCNSQSLGLMIMLAHLFVSAERARKLRQCLTPQCDAPRYLVGPSGYCKECEERGSGPKSSTASSRGGQKQRHRRHRSWDANASVGGFAVRKNIKNTQVVALVRILREEEEGEEQENGEENRVGNTKQQQLLAALKQLAALLKENESLKDDLPECLAIKAVLALMHRHSCDLVLQLEGCKCLSVAVFNHDRNRLIVVAEGAVDLVLAAMKRFQPEVKMQEVGCVLLTNLAHTCETNRKRILDAGGVDAVLQTMQMFPQHCGVQKRSCWALLTLAGSDFLCDSIAMKGGLGAVIAAMLNCPADEYVQYYGSWALVNLVSGTSRLQAFARREGVAEVAEAALACFPEHEGIQEKTLEILRLLG
ncbi:hypothetical protein BBJ28_00010648, partial [Nothophytophthora sp. Chile5]